MCNKYEISVDIYFHNNSHSTEEIMTNLFIKLHISSLVNRLYLHVFGKVELNHCNSTQKNLNVAFNDHEK